MMELMVLAVVVAASLVFAHHTGKEAGLKVGFKMGMKEGLMERYAVSGLLKSVDRLAGVGINDKVEGE